MCLIRVGDRVKNWRGDLGNVTRVLKKEGRAYVEFDEASLGRTVWGVKLTDIERVLQQELFDKEKI